MNNDCLNYLVSKHGPKYSNYAKPVLLYIVISVFIFLCIFAVCWYCIRPGWYKKFYENLKQFKGFKYFHLTNQEEQQEPTPPITSTKCHFSKFGSSGLGITRFLN